MYDNGNSCFALGLLPKLHRK